MKKVLNRSCIFCFLLLVMTSCSMGSGIGSFKEGKDAPFPIDEPQPDGQ